MQPSAIKRIFLSPPHMCGQELEFVKQALEKENIESRPALYNQDDLIELRTKKGIHVLTPGLTGWAQINGRDELPIPVYPVRKPSTFNLEDSHGAF